jgi:hypothetical protein
MVQKSAQFAGPGRISVRSAEASFVIRARQAVAGAGTASSIDVQEEARVADSASQIFSACRTILWAVNVYRYRTNRPVVFEDEAIKASFADTWAGAFITVRKAARAV